MYQESPETKIAKSFIINVFEAMLELKHIHNITTPMVHDLFSIEFRLQRQW